jgi:outer membrane protein
VLSLKKNIFVIPALGIGLATLAFSQTPCANPTKIAIISMGDALQNTKEGQKAGNELQTKFRPKQEALEKRQADVQAKQATLSKGRATMSADALAKLQSDIDSSTKSLSRDMEDTQAEIDEEKGKVLNALGEKMMGVLSVYSQEACLAAVLDVSMEQTPVLWAASSVNITETMVKKYDEKYPLAAGAAAPAAPARPAGTPAGSTTVTRPAATPPPAAPAGKKQ